MNHLKLLLQQVKEKKFAILCTAQENYRLISLLLITFSTIQILFQLVGLSSLLFMSFTMAIHCILFSTAATKEFIKYSWIVFIVQIMMFLLMILNYMVIQFINLLFVSSREYMVIIFVFDIFISGIGIYFYFKANTKIILKELFQYVPSDYIFRNKTEEIEVGSLRLGKDIDTGKYHYIPPTDRFLHTLILGATGTGKTSQVIIPAIQQDIYECPETGVIVIEPKQDLAEKVWAMAVHNHRDVIYFNPVLSDCPYFNPLVGDESDVLENMATTFKMLNPDAPIFFQNMSEDLIKKAIKVVKRMYGDNATLLDLQRLIFNTNNAGGIMIAEFQVFCDVQRRTNPSIDADIITENQEIIAWFIHDYFSGSSGERTGTKTYEHCTGIRAQVSKLCSNKYLRKVLNPPKGAENGLDFDYALAKGQVITVATAQGALRDLGSYLGYFIIFQLQSAVFRRKGNENTRRHCHLYIDECQKYLNPGFADLLTQGRSYRVATTLATQNKALLGFNAGKNAKAFIDLITTNCRNVVIYPGGNIEDAEYYSKQFGEIIKKEMQKGFTVQKNGIFNIIPSGISEQTRLSETLEARFSPSDIIFRPFGQITAMYIKHNSIQVPVVLQIEYIDKELNQYLDKMIEAYNTEQEEKALKLHGESIIHDIQENNQLQPSKSLKEEENETEDDKHSENTPSFYNSGTDSSNPSSIANQDSLVDDDF